MRKNLVIVLLVITQILSFIPNSNAEVTVSHFLGIGGMGKNDGDAKTAKFSRPADVVVDSKGNSFILDANGIRKIDSSNNTSTLYQFPLNGQNSFYCGLTIDKDSNFWFADCRRSTLYKVSNSGTLLKTINLPYAQNSWMTLSPGVDALPDGSILVSVWLDGKIIKVSPDGNVSVFYQSSTNFPCNSYPKPAGTFCPVALTTTPNGEVYVLNSGAQGNEVIRVNSDSSISKVNTPVNPTNVEYTNNSLYVSVGDTSIQQEWQLFKTGVNQNSQLVFSKADANRWSANGFKFLDSSTLVMPSYDNNLVRKINISSGAQTLIGDAKYGSDDGSLASASTQFPSGLTEDNDGNLYFLDFKGVRKISNQNIVTTIYKTQFNTSGSLIFQNQSLYFVDNNQLRKLDLNGNVISTINLNITGDFYVGTSGSLAINKTGQIYVVMYRNNDYSTKYIRKYDSPTIYKDLSPTFQNNTDLKIVVDSNDSLLIASSSQIRKYTSDNLSSGTYVSSYPGYGQNFTVSNTGDIYIFSQDQNSSFMNLVKSDGSAENLINGAVNSSTDAGIESGFGTVNGILYSKDGYIYIADSSNNSIRKVKVSSTKSTTSTSSNTNTNNSSSTSNNNSAPAINLRKPTTNANSASSNALLKGLSEVRYKGYFGNNTGYFTDNAVKTQIGNTLASQLPIWSDTTEMGTDVSMWWGGYFIPDETGIWDFQITSDDASFMWIGNEAVSRYGNGFANAFISLPNDHAPLTENNSIKLEKDKIYPIRIQYGNQGGPAGTFKFEIKPPSFKTSWDTNLTGLIWHSDFSNSQDCTNYGISYSLSAKLGYDIIDVPNCKNNPAVVFGKKSEPAKPQTPTLNKINVSGNTINLTVNLGNSSNKPDKVYIVAPQLGLDGSNSSGKISGTTASWAIPVNKSAAGKSTEIQVISSKNGVESTPMKKLVNIPSAPKNSAVTKIPAAPTPQVKTVICKKGSQSRTFAGKVCPPGWN